MKRSRSRGKAAAGKVRSGEWTDEQIEARAKQKQYTPEALRKLLHRAPAPWDPGRGGKDALSIRVVSEVQAAKRGRVSAATDHSQFLAHEHIGATRMKAILGNDRRRIETEGRGLFGHSMAIITRPSLGGVYLDLETKTFLQFDSNQLPGLRFVTPARSSLKHCGEEELDGRMLIRVEVTVESPVRALWIIWLDPDGKLDQYARRVMALVGGCPDAQAETALPFEELSKLGMPVAGEVFEPAAEGGWERRWTSRFRVTDVTFVSDDDDYFTIPEGYRDLRRKPNKQERYEAPIPKEWIDKFNGRATPQRDPAGGDIEMDAEEKGGGELTGQTAGFLAARSDRPIRVPQCLPSTFGAQFAIEAQQLLADDIRFLANAVSRRLSGFGGSSGTTTIDWLNQFEAFSTAQADGDGLFCMMRDTSLAGSGILDKLALRQARRLMVDGNILTQLTLSPAIQAEINAILANASIAPADRFDALSAASQRTVREAFLAQKLASFAFNYPTTTGWQSIFHDLVRVRLDGISFDVRINNTGVFTTLDLGDNLIHLVMDLPQATGSALVTRVPSSLYWEILGLSVLACIFLPFLCALLPLIALAGWLLTDFGAISIELSNIRADVRINFVPNASGVLIPSSTPTFTATPHVFYTSFIPDGLHQAVNALIAIVLTHTNFIVSTVQGQLKTLIDGLMQNTLHLQFPPEFGPVPISAISADASGVFRDHLYLSAGINAGLVSVSPPFVTQVDSQIETRFLGLRAEFQAGEGAPPRRHYGGFVLSQNFINFYVNTLWARGTFNYTLTPPETDMVMQAIRAAYPALEAPELAIAHVWPAVTPRTMLTPTMAAEGKTYATTFFDDVRLCVGVRDRRQGKLGIIEFQFAGQANTEIGFGAPEDGKLNLLKVTDRFFDLYFDLESVHVIAPEIQDTAESGTAFDGFGLVQLAHPEMQTVFAKVLTASLADQSITLIPRDPDNLANTIQRYVLLGTDSLVGAGVYVELWPHRGNIYVHAALGGMVTRIFPGGSLNIDTMNCLTGRIIAAFA